MNKIDRQIAQDYLTNKDIDRLVVKYNLSYEYLRYFVDVWELDDE